MARTGRTLILVVALLALGYTLWRCLPQGRHPVAPEELTRLAAQMEQQFHVDRSLILAVVENESGGDAWAQSPAGAVGLMQLLPATAADLASRHRLAGDLRDPAANMALGSAYLRELGDRFGDQPDLVIAAYHAGPTRVAQWRREEPSLSIGAMIQKKAGPQTRAYVANVKASWAQYRKQRTEQTQTAER